jgi:hypothetical protein
LSLPVYGLPLFKSFAFAPWYPHTVAPSSGPCCPWASIGPERGIILKRCASCSFLRLCYRNSLSYRSLFLSATHGCLRRQGFTRLPTYLGPIRLNLVHLGFRHLQRPKRSTSASTSFYRSQASSQAIQIAFAASRLDFAGHNEQIFGLSRTARTDPFQPNPSSHIYLLDPQAAERQYADGLQCAE